MSTFILALTLWFVEITGCGDVLDPVIGPVSSEMLDIQSMMWPESSVEFIDDMPMIEPESSDIYIPREFMVVDQTTDGNCATITAR